MPAEHKAKGTPRATGQKRTKTGCSSCKARKAKCDEIKPRCTRCQKAGVECLWPHKLAKEELFKTFEQLAMIASADSSLAHSSASTSRSSDSMPMDAVASSSRTVLVKTPSSALELSYPVASERLIMHNFLSMLQQMIGPGSLADGLTRSFGPPATIDNVLPNLCIREFLSTPRPSLAREAVSLAFLSIGACQVAWSHHISATDYSLDSNSDLAIVSLDQQRTYAELSTSMVSSSLSLIRTSGTLLVSTADMDESVAEQLDLLLVAATFLFWTHLYFGEAGSADERNAAKQIVTALGGPVAILERAKRKGPTKLRQVRSTLEEVVMIEEFSSLSNGTAPDLSFDDGLDLSGSDELGAWYTEYAPPLGTWRTAGSPDWETVEACLGLSRRMVHLLHRVNLMYTRTRPPGWEPDAPTALYPFTLDSPSQARADALLAECNAFESTASAVSSDEPSNWLDTGNRIFSVALAMVLLLDVFCFRADHPEVLDRARLVCKLAIDETKSSGVCFRLMWPIAVAASCAIGEDDRANARAAMDTRRGLSYFDLASGWVVGNEVWRRRDAGDAWCSWRSVNGHNGGLLLL